MQKAILFDLDGTLTDSGEGIINSVIPALEHFGLKVPSREELENLAQMLTQALEMAVGLRPPGPLLERLSTQEAQQVFCLPEGERVISFSGGVADCIEQVHPPLAFGDLGPTLGQAIRRSRL